MADHSDGSSGQKPPGKNDHLCKLGQPIKVGKIRIGPPLEGLYEYVVEIDVAELRDQPDGEEPNQ